MYGVFKRYLRAYINKIIDSGVIPIFVIEGKAPDMKMGTVQKRTEMRTSNETKADVVSKNIDIESFKKKLAYAYMPNQEHVKITIEVLSELNVHVLRAKHEAEGVCAFLVNTPLDHPLHCDCALTDDYDIFMYGCKAVIRDLRAPDKDSIKKANDDNIKPGYFECVGYAYRDILYGLGLLPTTSDGEPIAVDAQEFAAAHKRFQLLCILSGTDYHENVKNLGPAKIFDKISKNNIQTYEQICELEPKFREIPYYDIIKVLKQNMEFTIINTPHKAMFTWGTVYPSQAETSQSPITAGDTEIHVNEQTESA